MGGRGGSSAVATVSESTQRPVFATGAEAAEVRSALIAGGLGAYVTMSRQPLGPMAPNLKAGFPGFAGQTGEWVVTAELSDSRTGNYVARRVGMALDTKQISALSKDMRAELKAKASQTSARIAAERGAR